MAKRDVGPAVGVVTVAAAAWVMIAWCAMTGGAVGHALVRNPDLLPGSGEMAAATVARIVSFRPLLGVAAVAIGLACVVEGHILPGDFLMAAAALPVIVVGRQLICVAVLAILVMRVVKGDVCPAGSIVAALAGAFVMGYGCFVPMTGQAVGQAIMVDVHDGPIFDITVALGTKAREVRLRYGRSMARFTGGPIIMFIGVLRPIFSVAVAVAAFAGIVGERRVLTVAGCTFGDVGVVVAECVPGGGVCMAALAVAGVMGGRNGRLRIGD